MHKAARQRYILDILCEKKQASIHELAAYAQVSVDTVRRDLAELERQGLTQKNHGGATTLNLPEMSRQARSTLLPEVKQHLGRAVAAQIPPGCSVILDAGSTMLAIAQAWCVSATVITTSLDIAHCLSNRSDIQLILLGGEWDRHQRLFSGGTTLSLLQRYRADLAILGACAVHQHLGVSATTADHADVQRGMLAMSNAHWLVTDHLKFDCCQPHRVADLSEFQHIFVNRPWLTLSEGAGANVRVVAD